MTSQNDDDPMNELGAALKDDLHIGREPPVRRGPFVVVGSASASATAHGSASLALSLAKMTADRDKARKLFLQIQREDSDAKLERQKKEQQQQQEQQHEEEEIDLFAFDETTPPEAVPVSQLSKFTQMLSSDYSAEIRAHGLLMIRKLCCVAKNPPIAEIIEAGVTQKAVELLRQHRAWPPAVVHNAVWIITNLCSIATSFTNIVIECGAIPLLVDLLYVASPSSPSAYAAAAGPAALSQFRIDVLDSAAWALGNIAGEGSAQRDVLLGHGAASRVIGCINTILEQQHRQQQPAAGGQDNTTTSFSSSTTLRTLTWLMAQLCRGKPSPDFSTVSGFLPLVSALLRDPYFTANRERTIDALWAVSYLTDSGSSEHVQAVIDSGVIDVVATFLHNAASANLPPSRRSMMASQQQQQQHPWSSQDTTSTQKNVSPSYILPSLRVFGNLSSGSSEHAQLAVRSGVPYLLPILMQPEQPKHVKKEACWMASNLLADASHEVVMSVAQPEVLEPAANLLEDSCRDVAREALWVFANAVVIPSFLTPETTEFLVQQCRIFPRALALMKVDARSEAVGLDTFHKILNYACERGYTDNPVTAAFASCGALQELQKRALEGTSVNTIAEKLEAVLGYFDVSGKQNEAAQEQ